jgi:hypothetical protein
MRQQAHFEIQLDTRDKFWRIFSKWSWCDKNSVALLVGHICYHTKRERERFEITHSHKKKKELLLSSDEKWKFSNKNVQINRVEI